MISYCYASQSNKNTDSNPARPAGPSLYKLLFAYYIFIIFYTTYCRRATTSSKLLVPNFFLCLGGEERKEQAKLWVDGGGWTPSPLFFIGLFSFPKMDGSLRRHSTFLEAGCPPLEESLRRMKTAAAMLALIKKSWPPASHIESTIATTTLVHPKPTLEAHRIADPGSGEEVFQSIKHWFKPSPSGRTLPLHIAFCILHIHYILHNLLLTSDDKLEAPGTKLLQK